MDRAKLALTEHVKILDAILSENKELAIEYLKEHILHSHSHDGHDHHDHT